MRLKEKYLVSLIQLLPNKIPNITYLATTTTHTAVENEKPSVSNLVKKTDYNTKISEIEKKTTDHDHDKYITTPESNKLTAESLAAKLSQVNLASKSDIANFVKKTDLNKYELNDISKILKQYQQKDEQNI